MSGSGAHWDQPGLTWDSGLTWDAGLSPNPGDVAPYLVLVIPEHADKPDFLATLTAYLQPLVDGKAVLEALTTLFDIDTALGIQLDALGLWIGRSRFISEPITGVFFTFDDGPGFDIGILKDPFQSGNELTALPDEQYRTLLKATIAANNWDGTVPGAYAAYAIVFGPGGYTLVILDHQDMSMDLVLGGPVPDALTLALFTGGYLSLKPAGVRVNNYIVSANSNAKIFVFDAPADSLTLGGFDTAAFPNFYEGT